MLTSQITPDMLPNMGQLVPKLQYPGDNCCTFYQDLYLLNPLDTFCHEGSLMEFNLGASENQYESFYCGKNTWVNLCKEEKDDGYCWGDNLMSWAGHTYNRELTTLRNASKSIKMGPYDPSNAGAVNLYD